MASYKDYINLGTNIDEKTLKKAIRSMASAANKRLDRIEQRGLTYYKGDEDLIGEKGYTAGYKRFGIRGMDKEQLQNEFKRVKNFLLNPISSLTGMKRENAKSKRTFTDREKKQYERMKKEQKTRGKENDERFSDPWEELKWFNRSIRWYTRLIDGGLYAPTPHESDRVREIVETVTYETMETMTPQEQWEMVVKKVKEYLGIHEKQQGYASTSDFVYGSSD